MDFLSKLKGKRILTELALIMLEEAPEKILKRIQDLDLLRFISPELTFDKEKEKLFQQMRSVLQWYELLYRGRPCDTQTFYTLGLVDRMSIEQVEDFCKKTEMSETLRKRILGDTEKFRETVSRLPAAIFTGRKSEIHRVLEPLSQETMLFIMAKTKSEEIKKAISNFVTYKDVMKPVFTGEDLKKLGIKEGPVYKEILETLKDAKIDLNLKTKEDEESFVKKYIIDHGIIV
jgi:tRNA nucleotidyltransferase (CCA-adding enzyme)